MPQRSRSNPFCRLIPGALVLMLVAGASAGADAAAVESAFDHPVTISGYAIGTAGQYDGGGIGGRLSWEFMPHRFGVDLYMDAMAVEWPGAFRHDHPIGFSLYRPFAIGPRVRLRPLLGACVDFSFISPSDPGFPASNDVLFGVHAGGGVEVLLTSRVTWFLDAQAIWYLGHDRWAMGWSGFVSGSLASSFVFQPSSGLQVHFG